MHVRQSAFATLLPSLPMNRSIRRVAASLALALAASAPIASAQAELVPLGSTWRYFDQGTDPGAAWVQASFDDAAWSAGPAQLGYGDGDEVTTVSYGNDSANKHVTTYFRHAFEVGDPAALGMLLLEVQRDDGVVVHLNGTEVFRDNLPAGPVGSGTYALTAVGGDDEISLLAAGVDPSLLVAGTNVIAAEIHQANVTSSDISFALRLSESPPAT